MNKRKPTYFRNSLDLRDRVQVKILRKRLKLSPNEFSTTVQKVGNSSGDRGAVADRVGIRLRGLR